MVPAWGHGCAILPLTLDVATTRNLPEACLTKLVAALPVQMIICQLAELSVHLDEKGHFLPWDSGGAGRSGCEICCPAGSGLVPSIFSASSRCASVLAVLIYLNTTRC